MLKDEIISLLLESESKTAGNLLSHLNSWIDDRWKDIRMQITSRLSKLKYLQPSLMN